MEWLEEKWSGYNQKAKLVIEIRRRKKKIFDLENLMCICLKP